MVCDVEPAAAAGRETTDAELASRAKHGDTEAFGRLVERYKERAYMIALGFVLSPDDAMDLSQEAFVKAFKAMRSFREGADFYPWFYAVLRNTCFNFLRKRKVRRESSLDAAQDHGFDVADGGPGPAAALEREEGSTPGESGGREDSAGAASGRERRGGVAGDGRGGR